MTTDVAGDRAYSEVQPEISARSWTGWQQILLPGTSSGPNLAQGRWVVHIFPANIRSPVSLVTI